MIEADIRTVDFKRYRNQQISLVAGGIPCQPYSQDGRGLGKDDPRDLLLEAVRIVKEVRPRAFVFENVVGLLHARHADHLANVLRRFRMAGYQTEIQRLECEDFGIAQQRSRLLIVGVRKELAGSFRMPPAFPQRRLNLGDALVDLMAANGWRGAEEWARHRREHPICDREGNVTGFGVLAPTIVKSVGERRPNDHQAWLSRGIDIAKLPDEAPTDEQGSVPGFLPGLTPRMRARLQGFPDSWNFSGGKTAMTNQVGNAAPPRLAQAVGLALVAAMKNVTWDWQALLWPQESERVLVDPPALDVNLDLQEIAPLAQLNDSKVVARA